MQDIGVVHLVRARNGIMPFRRFLESYIANHGGIDHDLLLVFKGFRGKEDLSEYKRLLGSLPCRHLSVRDFGYDIRPYFLAANSFEYRYLCFLNSFSVIQDKEWLSKMHLHLSAPGVGLVGSTGSWQSPYTDSVTKWNFLAGSGNPGAPHHDESLSIRKLKTFILGILFLPFPNPHLRTNAFIISRDTMLRVKWRTALTKFDAYRFESGKNSLTRQVMEMGLEVLVVGRDGKAYRKGDWAHSGTFWQAEQQNLLVADNQTNLYSDVTPEMKARFSEYAWSGTSSPLVRP
jgi:hypothetical protein